MDYKPAKAANIAFGALSTGLASYNVGYTIYVRGMDTVFIVIASICTIEAIVSLLLAFFWQTKGSAVLDQVLRGIICLVLIGSGIGLLISAVDVEENWCLRYRYGYEDFEDWRYYYYDCQLYEVKLAAGIIAIVNGLIYAIAKKKYQPQKPVVFTGAPAHMAGFPVVPFMMVQGQETQYMPQQDHRLPRFQSQQNHNSNYADGPPIHYPRQNNPLQQNTSPHQYQYNYHPNQQRNLYSSHQQ